MKKLLILLFSLFFLISSPSIFADDISDFEIEGMSIGDSLLDYMTEDEILEEIELNKDDYYYLNEPNKYAEVYLWKDFPTYDQMTFIIKNNLKNQFVTNKNDEKDKYTILSIRGIIQYQEDFDGCIVKRDEVVGELTKMFPNALKEEWTKVHPLDPSGNSIFYLVTMVLSNGDEVKIHCSNWDETFRLKNKMSEGLSIELSSKEVVSWLAGYENSIQ